MTQGGHQETDTDRSGEKMSLGCFYNYCAGCGVTMERAIDMYVEFGGNVYLTGFEGTSALDREIDSGKEKNEESSEESSEESNEEEVDNRVFQLQQITGIDTELAKKLLDECNGAVEVAVNKFYGEQLVSVCLTDETSGKN